AAALKSLAREALCETPAAASLRAPAAAAVNETTLEDFAKSALKSLQKVMKKYYVESSSAPKAAEVTATRTRDSAAPPLTREAYARFIPAKRAKAVFEATDYSDNEIEKFSEDLFPEFTRKSVKAAAAAPAGTYFASPRRAAAAAAPVQAVYPNVKRFLLTAAAPARA
ncbi:hypothetical protein EDEG_04263, partial [Edhazardia aedis USNM 41457]